MSAFTHQFQNIHNFRSEVRFAQACRGNDVCSHPTARAIVTFIVGPGMSMRLAAVGTDEGDIYLVTTEYASTYLASYRAHATPVYNIQWNNFIPTVFLSCAAEWTVKIWDMNYSKVRGHVKHVRHVTRHLLRPAPLHLRRGCAGGRRVLGAVL